MSPAIPIPSELLWIWEETGWVVPRGTFENGDQGKKPLLGSNKQSEERNGSSGLQGKYGSNYDLIGIFPSGFSAPALSAGASDSGAGGQLKIDKQKINKRAPPGAHHTARPAPRAVADWQKLNRNLMPIRHSFPERGAPVPRTE